MLSLFSLSTLAPSLYDCKISLSLSCSSLYSFSASLIGLSSSYYTFSNKVPFLAIVVPAFHFFVGQKHHLMMPTLPFFIFSSGDNFFLAWEILTLLASWCFQEDDTKSPLMWNNTLPILPFSYWPLNASFLEIMSWSWACLYFYKLFNIVFQLSTEWMVAAETLSSIHLNFWDIFMSCVIWLTLFCITLTHSSTKFIASSIVLRLKEEWKMLWLDYVRHLKTSFQWCSTFDEAIKGVTDINNIVEFNRCSSCYIKLWIKGSSISTRTFFSAGKSLDFIKLVIKQLAIIWCAK